LAEAQMLRQADALARLGQRLFANQAGAQPRQLAFGELREAGIKLVGDRAAQHAVAEEFQPLVVVVPVAAVRQRLLEELRGGEPVTDPLFESRSAGQSALTGRCSPGSR